MVGLMGCNGPKSEDVKPKKETTMSATTKTADDKTVEGEFAVTKSADAMRAKVVETMDASIYTYLRLASDQGDAWAAAPKFVVSVGDEVEISGIMKMAKFYSKTLDRTFDEILFVEKASVVSKGPGRTAQPAGSAGMASGMPPNHPDIASMTGGKKNTAAAEVEIGSIEPVTDGQTVAGLFKKQGELDGKSVKFRGKVVKINRRILGKDWLHIQDGTGEAGTNDIAVTTAGTSAEVGDIVIVSGTLNLNRDFGAGYKYDLIVEDATVTKE